MRLLLLLGLLVMGVVLGMPDGTNTNKKIKDEPSDQKHGDPDREDVGLQGEQFDIMLASLPWCTPASFPGTESTNGTSDCAPICAEHEPAAPQGKFDVHVFDPASKECHCSCSGGTMPNTTPKNGAVLRLKSLGFLTMSFAAILYFIFNKT